MAAKLTIVVPVYNVKDYLNECLDSIARTDFKLILVNDGSTDGSELICQEFQQKYPEVLVINKPNGGLSDARNAAYQYVDTEYVFFLDSDDYIDAQNLKGALEFAIKNNLDWVQCGYVYKYDSYLLQSVKYSVETIISQAEALAQLVNDSYIKNFAWGKIYRWALVKDFLFPKGKFFEDVLWQYLVLSHCTRIGIYPKIVCYYRQRGDSISGSFSARNFDLLNGLRDRLSDIAQRYPSLEPLAAFNLWQLCNQYKPLCANNADKTLLPRLMMFEKVLNDDFGDSIHKGINSRPLLKRLESKAAMSGAWYNKLLHMANRIIDRLTAKQEYKVIYNG